MNARIIKLKEEYDKTASKIAYLQGKNKKIAEKITQLENDDIIGAVRNSGLTIDELLSLLGKSEKADESKKTLTTNFNMEEKDDEI